MTTSRQPKGGFYIGVTCPGCGGGLELQEDFFVLKCSHCGSVLRVVMPETPPAYIIEVKKKKREIRFKVDRYLKENGRPLTQSDFTFEKIYYPYWKVDGIRLKIPPANINKVQARNVVSMLTSQLDYTTVSQVGRAVGSFLTESPETSGVNTNDLSVNLVPYRSNQTAGPEIEGIPYSIGLRTEYVRMIPYRQENIDEEFEYVPVTKPWEDVLAHISGAKTPKGVEFADADYLPGSNVIRPKGSVVYFPYFLCSSGRRRIIVDGLNGRVVHESDLAGEESPSWPDPHLQFGELEVILHRCPDCGIDLPSTPSQVYICRNCQTVVSLNKDTTLDHGIFSSGRQPHSGDPMFPFWVFRLHRKTVGQIAKVATVGPPPDKLVIPAFRISNFKVMRRLTQRMTAAFARFPSEAVEEFDRNFRPVDLSLTEAVALAEICLYCEKAGRNPEFSIESVKINPRKIELFYAPFHSRNYFYVDSVIEAVTFAKNSIAGFNSVR